MLKIPSPSSIYPLIFTLVILSLSSISLASPISSTELSPLSFTSPKRRAYVTGGECGFKGDDNTYGFGIRIGLYLQWITTSIANNFVPEEAVTMRGVNNCFQLSLFIALLISTLQHGINLNANELYAVEAWILLSLCIGGVCSGNGPSDKDGNDQTTFASYQASTLGGLVRLVLGSGIVFYTIWFIYVGIDQMKITPCSQYAFFFTKVVLDHWYRTFLKVFFTMTAVGTGFALILVAMAITVYILSSPSAALHWLTDFNEEWKVSHKGPPRLKITNLGFSLALPYFIASIELMIRWNHIEGVDISSVTSTGQLIPLVVGAAGLLRVLYKFMMKALRGDYS